jgi:hypothetical protein
LGVKAVSLIEIVVSVDAEPAAGVEAIVVAPDDAGGVWVALIFLAVAVLAGFRTELNPVCMLQDASTKADSTNSVEKIERFMFLLVLAKENITPARLKHHVNFAGLRVKIVYFTAHLVVISRRNANLE